jgi:septal ring factor EnvC (AmiA/AmiB activator)
MLWLCSATAWRVWFVLFFSQFELYCSVLCADASISALERAASEQTALIARLTSHTTELQHNLSTLNATHTALQTECTRLSAELEAEKQRLQTADSQNALTSARLKAAEEQVAAAKADLAVSSFA